MDHDLIACNMAVFTPAQQQRYQSIKQQLADAVREVREVPGGYTFHYASSEAIWLLAAEFVDLERRCCPFFTFTLVRAADGVVSLTLTGPAGAQDVLAANLQPTNQASR